MRLQDEEASDIRSLTYSPDGSRLISYGGDNVIRVWDTTSGKKVLAIEMEDRVQGRIAISRDGKLIALGGSDETILIWDATNGRQLMKFRGHKGPVRAVSFSPVADRLATCCYDDGTVKIWDTTSGLKLMTLVGENVYDVAFSPDGSTVAAACLDGIILWETKEPTGGLDPRRNAQAVRQLVQRLHQKYGTYQDVMDQLSGDDTLDASVREMALQIVDSRMPQEAYDIAWNVLNTIVPFEKDTQEYQTALVKLEKANHLVPDHWIILTALGAVQCRLGSYEDALKSLPKSEQIYSDMAHELNLVGLTFRVIALHRIGQIVEAKAALEQLQGQLGQGESALHYAARNGYKHLVEFLLGEGADMSSINTEGFTPIEVAMGGDHTEIVKLLASKGADISPLHLAIYLRDEARAKSLIESGADVNKQTPNGTTPLYRAVGKDLKDISELLIEHGADVNKQTPKGATPLNRAVGKGLKDISELLIEHGADVNAGHFWGWTPLHSAAKNGYKNIVELLMAHGANVNAKDGDRRTPLYYAKEKGHTEIVELLWKHGAKE